MREGKYVLMLTCDVGNEDHEYEEFPHEFEGPTQVDCVRAARKAGWSIGPKRDLCPRCSGKIHEEETD